MKQTSDASYESNREKMKRRKRQCGQICLLFSGIILVTLGLSIFIFFEDIYEAILRNGLKFAPNSKPYEAWKANDPPLDLEMYLFNWTNSEDARNASVKPKFEEIGPYRFKEIKEKVNITWHKNDTISYKHRKIYYFDEENSVRDLSDVITTINAVPLTVAYQARYFGFWSKKAISLALSSISSLAVTKTAREILFDGYEESILSILSKFPVLNVHDRFGIFYKKNGTVGVDGIFSMSVPNDNKFGSLVTWNFENKTNFYEGHCNDIRGSAGEFYPLNIKKDKLVIFSPDLCKYAELEYREEVVIKGVRGYKFSADNIFDNGTKRPENACFCKGECLPSGVFNVSACRENSPSFLSLPHFYGADPYYANLLDGMKPNKEKHEFYIIIQPKSGIVMDIAPRMQVNMLLQPVSSISIYSVVPKVFVPLFYFTQHIELRDDLAKDLLLIQNLPEYGNYASLIFASIGVILICWGICSLFFCAVSNQKQELKQKYDTNTQHEQIPLNEKL